MQESIGDRAKKIVHGLRTRKPEVRPETIWLAEQYNLWRRQLGGLSKGQADRLIYQRMYGQASQKPSDLNKIRFWRTGLHLPVNGQEALRFARAMEFSREQEAFFFRSCLDYPWFPDEAGRQAALELLKTLKQEYLMKVNPSRILAESWHRRPEKSFRHLYYRDAADYTCDRTDEKLRSDINRFDSVSFGSELLRIQRMEGKISRKSMIRHLILLGAPFVSVSQLNSWLVQLGFAPLNKNHVSVDNTRLDLLVIRLLTAYEELAAGREYTECECLLKELCARTDALLCQRKLEKLRFMYFKSLKNARTNFLGGQNIVFEHEFLEWEKNIHRLRTKYTQTPAGYRSEQEKQAAADRLRQREQRLTEQEKHELQSPLLQPAELPAAGMAVLPAIEERLQQDHCLFLCGADSASLRALARYYGWQKQQQGTQVLLLPCGKNLCETIADDENLPISGLRYDAGLYQSRYRYFCSKLQALKELAGRRELLLILEDFNRETDRYFKKLCSELPCGLLFTSETGAEAYGKNHLYVDFPPEHPAAVWG